MASTLTTTESQRSQTVWDWLRFFNCWSLDAPAVAWCWSGVLLCSGHSEGTTTFWSARVLLVLVVWLLYAGDRLLDVRHLDWRAATTERHQFARRHGRMLWVIWCVVLMLLVGLAISQATPRMLVHGGVLAMPVLGYFGVVHALPARRFPKELLAGTLFAGGCVIPLSLCSGAVLWLPAAGLLGGLCVVNCLLVAWGQLESDQEQSIPSLIGHHRWITRWLPWACGLIAVLSLGVCWLGPLSWVPAIACCGAAGGLGWLSHELGDRPSQDRERLSLLADALLGVPAYVAVWIGSVGEAGGFFS